MSAPKCLHCLVSEQIHDHSPDGIDADYVIHCLVDVLADVIASCPDDAERRRSELAVARLLQEGITERLIIDEYDAPSTLQ